MIKNRLQKNHKKLKSWIKEQNIQCFRLYDRDIPEYPFIVDCYGQFILIYDRRESDKDFSPEKIHHLDELTQSLKEMFPDSSEKLIFKERRTQGRFDQYQKISQQNQEILLSEGPFKFLVNLWDYLDTGLFLDHRPLRKLIFKSSKHKKVLNLFSYTCSISVAAALGGAQVTSVDLNQRYLDWGIRNFQKNNIPDDLHQFVQADILDYLSSVESEYYDLIILDPPTFSNSKKMSRDLDIIRDHPLLIDQCLKALKKEGTLFFSCNKRKFRLNKDLLERTDLLMEDITNQTIPADFRDPQIHVCFNIQKLDN